MLVWATEFPVSSENGCNGVLTVAKNTLSASPHSLWRPELFGDDPTSEMKRLEQDGQVVTIGCAESQTEKIAGLQHQWVEDGEREWNTEIVGHEADGNVIVSVRLNCNLLRPGLTLPIAKKPYYVRQILEDLEGGEDAGLVVQDSPHFLAEPDVSVAARLVLGKSGVRLPVVYVSVGRSNRPFIDVRSLAQWLGGMAHVVVEPSRYFAFALARNTGRMNAYGGAVSIYWPSAAAAQMRFLPSISGDAVAMQKEIVRRVRRALTHIRPESRCTFQYLRELTSRAEIERLQAEGSTEVNEYVAVFDAETKAKDERLAEMGRELARLHAELSRYQRAGDTSEGILAAGSEREYYHGEHLDALIHALRHSRNSVAPEGRRQHLVDDILKANEPTSVGPELEAEIKEAFAQSGDLGPSQRRTLQDLGFDVEDSSKHWKVTYQGDSRYMFTISKSSSDHRAGKNLASSIIKKLLK